MPFNGNNELFLIKFAFQIFNFVSTFLNSKVRSVSTYENSTLVELVGDFGIFSSQDYPSPYPPNWSQSFRITSNAQTRILVKFQVSFTLSRCSQTSHSNFGLTLKLTFNIECNHIFNLILNVLTKPFETKTHK